MLGIFSHPEKHRFEYNFSNHWDTSRPTWFSMKTPPQVDIDEIIGRFENGDFSQQSGLWAVVALAIGTGSKVPSNLPMYVYIEAMEMVKAYNLGARICPYDCDCCEFQLALDVIARYMETKS